MRKKYVCMSKIATCTSQSQEQVKEKWNNISKTQGRHVTIRYRNSTLVTKLNISTLNVCYRYHILF